MALWLMSDAQRRDPPLEMNQLVSFFLFFLIEFFIILFVLRFDLIFFGGRCHMAAGISSLTRN